MSLTCNGCRRKIQGTEIVFTSYGTLRADQDLDFCETCVSAEGHDGEVLVRKTVASRIGSTHYRMFMDTMKKNVESVQEMHSSETYDENPTGVVDADFSPEYLACKAASEDFFSVDEAVINIIKDHAISATGSIISRDQFKIRAPVAYGDSFSVWMVIDSEEATGEWRVFVSK